MDVIRIGWVDCNKYRYSGVGLDVAWPDINNDATPRLVLHMDPPPRRGGFSAAGEKKWALLWLTPPQNGADGFSAGKTHPKFCGKQGSRVVHL